MAELDQSSSRNRKTKGVPKSKKLSTRVDLTPMVDLGFLLITFFIFTTSLSRPKTMALYLPKDVPHHEEMPVPASGALTLLLSGKDQIYYYEGDDLRTMHFVSSSGIRSVILEKKMKTDPSKFMVVIKPGRESSFKNVVGILDEMVINGVKRYAMVEISPEESAWMRKIE
jgi:biopolymer transport protein ExbD